MSDLKKKILVVDDEENVQQLLKKVLINEGFGVELASNGKIALEILEKSSIDILISDIKMPEMDGIDLLKEIQRLNLGIKVILITAFASVNTAINALRFGASDYITKPFDIDEILFSVKKLSSNLSKDINELDEIVLNNPNLKVLKSKSPSMLKTIQLINQIADSQATVLIQGETGTGKELIAHTIHELSQRKNKALIKCNCSAIPDTLLESELFGYEKGAFTGAVQRKPGRFELADGGTLFLDEIAEIPMIIQTKLLRAIQEREFERLGGIKTVKTDIRIITASNKDLEKEVELGNFREDLFYRLNVVHIQVPPLRERKEDLEELIQFFLQKSSKISNRPVKSVSNEVMSVFYQYNWPGNIRELENVIERCVLVSKDQIIHLSDLPEKYVKNSLMPTSDKKLDNYIDQTEQKVIISTLKECAGNRTKASEMLGISRRSLQRKIAKYQIED